MRTVPTAAVAAASLVAGYAVAAGTGARPLGGAVLVAGVAWCVPRWSRLAGRAGAAALVAAGALAFAGSHVIAGTVGAWPAVLAAATAVGAAAWWVADRRAAADGDRLATA